MMGWPTRRVPLWTLITPRDEFNQPDMPLLTVVSDYGVRVRDLADGRAPSEDLSGYRVVRAGDLVVNKMWARFGAYGVSSYTGIISPAYWVLTPDPDVVEPLFLHHLLRSALYRAEIWKRSKDLPPNGFDLPWDQFRTIAIPLPSISTQRAIADYLDLETARIDSLFAAKQRMVALLDERFAALASALLFHSSACRPVRLKFICGIPTSGNRDHGNFTYTAEGVPCLRGIDLSGAHINLSTVLRISPEDSRRHANTVLHVGDLVIVRSGATAGRSALVTEQLDGSNCVDLVVVRTSPELEPRYLAYVVRSRETQSAVLQEASGALQPHFNAVHAAEIKVPMRPLHEQQRLVAKLDTWRARKERLVEMLSDQTDLLQGRRQALITAAVTGEIDIPGMSV
jgi:type I restriction enzyme S subunit